MPTPASPNAISVKNVENTLNEGISTNYPGATARLTFNDSMVRTLAGRSSGSISMNDMRGKAGPTPFGTVVSSGCSGSTLSVVTHDGRYGTTTTTTINSPACGYADINWDVNLTGGSSALKVTGTNIWSGGILPNNGVMSWNMQVVVPLAYSLTPDAPPTPNGTWLYWYIDYAEWKGSWLQNGDADIGPWSQTWFSSSQVSTQYFVLAIGGTHPRKYSTTGSISNIFYQCHAKRGLVRGYDEGLLPGLELIVTSGDQYQGGIYNTNTNGTAWDVMQTFQLTNKTGKDLFISGANGNNGTKVPIVIVWEGQNSVFKYDLPGYSDYGGTRMLAGTQTVYGRPLTTSVNINGYTVTYLAPNGVNRDGLLAGLNTAINNAGIPGVSSIINAYKHLIIYGITSAVSVSYGNNGTPGSTNIAPSVTNYLR
jgi:hypothetical protein